MTRTVGRVAWYRFRATFRARWTGYLAIVLLVGALGGLAMGAVAAARRTQSSFSTFFASTNPSTLTLGTAIYNPAAGLSSGYNAALVREIARLPQVRHVENYGGFAAAPLRPDGQPTTALQNDASAGPAGSIDGLYFNQDRVTVVHGRMADPSRADQIMMPAPLAHRLGFHIGQVITWGIYTNLQAGLSGAPGQGAAAHPAITVRTTLVGLVTFNGSVVQDEIDARDGEQLVLFTPALTRRLVSCCLQYSFSALTLRHGTPDVPAVEAAISALLPRGLPRDFSDPSVTAAKANRAIEPESVALGVFGGIAALAALLIAAQVIGRQLRLDAADAEVLRALGADPAMTVSDGLLGVLLAVAAGAVLAVAVAIGLSPLAPLGPVRAVYPTPGVALDGTVLGFGFLVLAVALSAIAVGIAVHVAPHRRAERRDAAGPSSSTLADTAAGSGLPPAAVAGIRLALEPGPAGTGVPVRSAIVGSALAMLVVTATLTFGSSLNTLVARPALYGWNWTYMLEGGNGVGVVPRGQATALLRRDHAVAQWTGVSFATLQLDGQTVPVLGAAPRPAVAPPLLSGHGFDASDQVVVGAATLAALHRRVGDTVEAGLGHGAPTVRLRIVGTATMPTIGGAGVATQHPTMGTGALLSERLIPASVRNSFGNSPDGPNEFLVRLRPGAAPRAAQASLNRIANTLTLPTNYGVSLVPVQRPAEIVNYRSMGTTPAILGGALGGGAVAALGLTLIASVRRRRRELALLKTLGFTRRQLASTVAWQASVAVGIGVLVGVPVGIAAGRTLWNVFSHGIYAVARPDVPLGTIVVVAVGAIVLANLVAAIPGQVAARTPTATLLRAE